MFRSAVDIANRALQHCGATRIDPTYGFNEDSRSASECGFIYDKLRRAEMRRNVWRFTIKCAPLRCIDENTALISPALWSSAISYPFGALVTDVLGRVWISQIAGNVDNDPGKSSGFWELYFGPLTASLYDPTTAYYMGEVVYTVAGPGVATAYLSLSANNSSDPTALEAWSATRTYAKEALVSYASQTWQSLVDFNANQTPTLYSPWGSGTTYVSGAAVMGSDGYIYTSVNNGNIGTDPVGDTLHAAWTATGVLAAWTTTLTREGSDNDWLLLPSVVLTPLRLTSPIGAAGGAFARNAQRNIFRLPANYLRTAPQDPKAGASTFLGAPSGLPYSDWLYEGQFILSVAGPVIPLRFVGDVTDVTQFDDMFCEGLAARMGFELAPILTQSNSKQANIASIYQKSMTEARTVNGIETGPTEPAEDDFLTVRL